jgi:hypothetical protein
MSDKAVNQIALKELKKAFSIGDWRCFLFVKKSSLFYYTNGAKVNAYYYTFIFIGLQG